MKSIFFLFLLLSAAGVFAQPGITGFSPASGNTGTTVTINGSGFDGTASNNIVFFGSVRATVNTASASSLSVTVPAGASYQPITVTVNGLTAYSVKPFVVTIPSVGGFSTSSFTAGASNYFGTSLYPQSVSAADLDGDGKPDLVTPGNYNSPYATFTVLRNTSTSGNPGFAAKQEFQTGDNAAFSTTADLDGDGKPDVITASTTNQGICVFRNTSSAGNISFAAMQTFSTGSNPYSIAIADFDKDGHPDIAVANYLSNTVSVLRNTSSIGNISLAAKIDLTAALTPRSVVAADLDGDGKADLAVTNELSNSVSYFKNLSSAGSISFSIKTDITTSNAPYGITAADLDGDGLNDLVAVGNSASKASVFRNTSSGGNISFAAKLDLSTGASPKSVSIDDANGDGKPDIITAAVNSAIYPNNSTPGTLSFGSIVYLWFESFGIGSADIDLDGKTDVFGANVSLSRVYVARNKCNEPIISYLTTSYAGTGNTVGIVGENLSGATSVTFGGLPASSFTVVNSTRINAVVGAGYSGNVTVTTGYGTGTTANFNYMGAPVITDFTPTSGGPGTQVGIRGKNFGGVNYVRFGGYDASTFTVVSTDSITAIVGNNGGSGNVEVNTGYGSGTKAGFTYTPPPVISNFTPTSAATGSIVTINGSNFTGTTSVKFGGVAATSFNVVSATQITAVVGPGTSGNVTVTSPAGTGSFGGFVHLASITSFSPTSAAGGAIVTINGYGFVNVTGVQFGTSWAASYTVNSATSITAVVHSSGASGNVSVITNTNTATLAGFTFIPPPVISSFYPKMTGAGGSVTITGQYFNNVTAVSFGGTPAASFTVNSPTSITAVVAQGTTGGITITTSPGGTTTLGGPLSADRFEFIGFPIINTFSPEAGIIGSTVTLRGANFSATAADNIVYFGPVKAEVLTASANLLTVKVPAGATYDRISVTTNGNTAHTLKPFLVNFTGGVLTANNFASKTYTAGSKPMGIAAADFDGDGKPDLAVSNENSNIILVYLNTSAQGVLRFASPISVIAGIKAHAVTTGDVDGDGKPDLISLSYGAASNDSVYVHRNTSTPGSLSFSGYSRAATGFHAVGIVFTDLSLDGKPDICVVNSGGGGPYGGYAFMPFTKNNSTPGNISLSDVQYYQAAYVGGMGSNWIYPNSIATGDFNADGKPDIVMGYASGGFLSVLRNYTTPGDPILSLDKWYTSSPYTGDGYADVAVSDFDNNGKPDVVTSSYIFGNITTATQQSTQLYGVGGVMAIADMDGDGKTDIAKTTGFYNTQLNTMRIRRNTSTSAISFDNEIQFGSGTTPLSIAVADFDLDGKPDVAVANYDSDNITVYENKIGEPISLCPGGSAYLISNKTGASYQWQVNTGSGFTNISAGANYGGVNDDSLILTNVPTGFDRYQFRCVVNGTTYSEVFTIHFLNTWTGSVNSSWENAGNWSCGSIPDSNTDVVLTSGTVTINSNVTVRTLSVGPGVNLVVSPGYTLTILK